MLLVKEPGVHLLMQLSADLHHVSYNIKVANIANLKYAPIMDYAEIKQPVSSK
jgi:hypothetical protein